MFTSSYSAPRRRNRKQIWVILTSSVVAHALAVATLAAIQLWHVEAVAEPPTNDVFQVQLPPPLLPAASRPPAAARPSPASHSTVPAAPTTPQPPAAQLAAITPHSELPPADVPAVSPLQPSASGPADGDGSDPFGMGSDSGSGAHGDRSGDAPLAVGGPISRPQVIRRVQPLYTERARKVRLQGAVVLQATIDEQGNVIDVVLIKPLRLGLDEEAVKAVRQWKFTPGTLHGVPVKVYFNLTVNFEVE